MSLPIFHSEEQTEQISPLHVRLKTDDTRKVKLRQLLTLKCSCKLTKTNSSISNHIITYKMKYIANKAMKSCEIFRVLDVALKLSGCPSTAC